MNTMNCSSLQKLKGELSISNQDEHGLYMEWDCIWFQQANCSHFIVVGKNSLWD